MPTLPAQKDCSSEMASLKALGGGQMSLINRYILGVLLSWARSQIKKSID